MNRKHILASVVALVLVGAMYYSWTHFKKRYENQDVDKLNVLLDQMESQGVPDFQLQDVTGKTVTSEVLKGKVTFINFWASWCDPCVREFPSMLQLVEHFNGELALVAISNDDNKEDMLNFVKAFGAQKENVYILWDADREVAKSFGTFKLPETFMVGPDGKLIRKIVGVERWFTDGSTRYLRDVIDSFKK